MKAWILLAMIGCASRQHQRCGDVGDHGVALVRQAVGRVKDAPPPSEAAFRELRKVIADHCEADEWSDEVVRCELAATDVDSVRACDSLFTSGQKAAMGSDQVNAIDMMYPPR